MKNFAIKNTYSLVSTNFRAVFAALAFLLCFSTAQQIKAATFTVTRTDDRNLTCVQGTTPDCSLREAVKAANNAATDDTIAFQLFLDPITLTSEIVINNAGTLIVAGNDSRASIYGNYATRIFYINGANVTLSSLRIESANGAGALNSGKGGAIYANGGSLTVNAVKFERNHAASSGGAIYANGSSLVFDSVHFYGNDANSSGGAVSIFGSGNHRIVNSTFELNYSGTCGAIAAFGTSPGKVNIANSTVSGNRATGSGSAGGGAICNTAQMFIRNSTITDNAAQNGTSGGGIDNYSGAQINVGNSIIAGNRANNYLEIYNRGVVTSIGNNLIGDSAGDAANTFNAITYQSTDLRDRDPLLMPLTYNYYEPDLTPTHALRIGSPAIDAGDNAKAVDPFNNSALTTDQRNSQRIVDGDNNGTATVDIGAYEVRQTPAAKEFIVNLTTDEPDANGFDGVCDVNLTASGLQCSLRAAIDEAENYAGNDRISFDLPANSIITLSNSLTIYSKGTLEIAGTGANNLTIRGIQDQRGITLGGTDLIISGITLTNSDRAIEASYSALTLDGVSFTGNKEAVFLLYATARILNSNISSNTSSVFMQIGKFEMINTTVSNNAGGIRIYDADATIRSSTITGNTEGFSGAGIKYSGGYQTLSLGNTIVAGNNAPNFPDIENGGGIVSAGYNLIGDSAGDSINTNLPITYKTSDIRDVNPLLSALGNNGGRTLTRALLTGSPAIDKGNRFGATADQRGFVRPFDNTTVANASDGSDIGAFEAQPTVTISGQVTNGGNVLPGVLVVLSGSMTNTTVTDSSGNYSFTVSLGGNYLITPSSTSYTFVPPNKTFNSPTTNQTANFAAQVCSYSINSASASAVSGSSTGTVSVTTLSGCAWSAAANVTWLTVTSGTNGNGNGTVGYTVAANTGPARSGTITIAGKTFTVNQVGGCAYTLSPTSASVVIGPSIRTFNVASEAGCVWTAVSNDSWLTISAGATGSGDGTVQYTVAANNGATRTGTITVAGQTFTVQQTGAVVFTVTRTDDRNNASCTLGDCSLREAIKAANATSADNIINFASGLTTITLTTANGGEMVINNAGKLTINGPGANVLTIDGGAGTNRIFYTDFATVTISGLTLTGGNGTGAIGNGGGGAIFAQGGSLTLDSVHVTGNSVPYSSGGISFSGVTSSIINSTISGNTAGFCGGFFVNSGTMIVVNSTISGNTATNSNGGGFCVSTDGSTTLRNVTITNNTASTGGGINLDFRSSLSFGNTIVAGNTATSGAGSEIQFSNGIITSAGNNLVGDSTNDSTNTGLAIVYQPTDIRDVNPLLGTLQNNGGKTPTLALLMGSPAIDKGNSFGATADQRGFIRPVDASTITNASDGSDIGAFELGPTTSAPTSNGQNVTVAPTNNLNLNFGNVTTAGNTSATVLNPNQVEPLPANFSLTGSSLLYNITTTAVFSGNITVTFDVPNISSATVCGKLRILHYVNNNWDISGNAAPVYISNSQTCRVSQIVTSLSPFVVAQYGGATYTISGQITSNSSALSNATVSLSGTSNISTTTDNAGNYSFANLVSGGNYTVTPLLSNYTFNQTSQSFNDLSANQTANFSASQCLYSLNPNAVNAPAASSTGSFMVTAPAGCSWTAATINNWITFSGATSGDRTGTVSYSVAANSGAERTASISVAGQNFLITQSGAVSSISGTVIYGIAQANQTSKVVSGVLMSASGTTSTSITTAASTGNYLLENLTTGGQYTVAPSKSGDVNGINSTDALRIQQYIVGNVALTPAQLAAADTSNNGTVNSTDALRIQQYIVQAPANHIVGQWKFLPASKNYSSLTASLSGEDYTAVLMGEVTGNWTPPASGASASLFEDTDEAAEFIKPDENYSPIQIITKQSDKVLDSVSAAQAGITVTLPTNATAGSGTTVTIPVNVSQLPALTAGNRVETYNFNLQFDPMILSAPTVMTTGTISEAAGGTLVTGTPQAGVLSVSYTNPNGITGQGALLNIQFTVNGSANQQTALTFVGTTTSPAPFEFNEGDPQAMTNTGQFTVMGTTAAGAAIGGRVMTESGRGIRSVRITLTDSSGNVRTATTTAFGYYRFKDVPAGQTYIVSAFGKRYTFSQPSQVLNITGNLTDINFIGYSNFFSKQEK